MEKPGTIVIAIRVSEDTPPLSTFSRIAETAHHLRLQGNRVIICITGGVNIDRLDHRRSEECPDTIAMDALAALCQGKLTALWGQLFSHLRQPIAQVPISKDDIESTAQLQKIQQVIKGLLMHKAIPIVSGLDRLLPAMDQSFEVGYLGCLVASLTGSAYIIVARTKRNDLHQAELRICFDLALMATTAMGIGTANFAAVHLECPDHGAQGLINHGCKLIIEDIEVIDRLPCTIEKLQAERIKY